MKKSFLSLIVGIFIGASVMLAVPAYGAVKQYILTEFTKPVIVNGVKYTDKEFPILNYNGKTYIPLAKIGELTGVDYKWNAVANRVEIRSVAGRANDVLMPDSVIEEQKEPGYKGYPDSADPSYQWAVGMGYDELPPLMSEGWISESMLHEIASIYFGGTGTPGEAKLYTGASWKETILHTFKLSEEFMKAENGNFVLDGFRVKKFNSNVFFNIADLEKAGVLKP
jgi:hypothetical protein